MFTLLLIALRFGLAFGLAIVGYAFTRRFVENRLRYVDAIHNPIAPVVAGGATFGASLFVFAFLPFVGFMTAAFLGIGVFAGVASGAREVRNRIGAG